MRIERWEKGSWDAKELNKLIDVIETRANEIIKEKVERINYLEKQNEQLINKLTKLPATIISYRGRQ